MTTLIEWAPQEFASTFNDIRAFKFKDVKVIKEYDMLGDDWEQTWKTWPGTHKNVMSWCILENGYAVGWNENPSRGWNFPVIKMKDE